MNYLDKIDYMIRTLYLAKSEIEYFETYKMMKLNDEVIGKDFSKGYGANHRKPNEDTVSECLNMVNRLGNQIILEMIYQKNQENASKDKEVL